jgi:hypothetical protein
LYGMSEYLMIMYEIEKARQARKDNQAERFSQVESPLSVTGKCIRKRTRTRRR